MIYIVKRQKIKTIVREPSRQAAKVKMGIGHSTQGQTHEVHTIVKCMRGRAQAAVANVAKT
jgi:hypothetical protein